ncbi:hypothetical protein OIDMADRAFT_48218 [Oidiodendron maius Zn]|uniref:Uncharacterized protein n=1 Tax=Oidiodendron maius (strain Zn) TaxID=913774 RepID=A0A0C3E214_OIDMZ|nr:hypothetical protein OIDMADRAFT_48218 [Oidiodendron maius Zn]
MPVLESLKHWAPFHIDALGIITLLAADSLRQSISRLVHNPFAEYLPLLAAHIFADNTIANPIPGFTLYNITDGVMATDLSAWWTRWLMCQKLNYNSTTFHVNALAQRRPLTTLHWALMVCINFTVNATLVVIPVLLGDWYGFASSVSLVAVIIARGCMLFSLRRSLDNLVERAEEHNCDPVTLFVMLPNGMAVTIRTTRGITTNVFLTEPRPGSHFLYVLFRGVTWLAFGVLVVSLGSACLCVQIMIVVTILLATIVVVNRLGCDERYIGRRLEIVQIDAPGDDARYQAYLNMNLCDEHEEALVCWHLLPMKYNTFWWNRYRQRQNAAKARPDDATVPTLSCSFCSTSPGPTSMPTYESKQACVQSRTAQPIGT